MANDKNLIPNSERTPIEIKEMTSNGGKRSGEVRREKKILSASLKVTVSLSYLILKENLHFISPCDIL